MQPSPDLDVPIQQLRVLREKHSEAADGTHEIALEGYGYRWFRVGGLDYLLNRSEV